MGNRLLRISLLYSLFSLLKAWYKEDSILFVSRRRLIFLSFCWTPSVYTKVWVRLWRIRELGDSSSPGLRNYTDDLGGKRAQRAVLIPPSCMGTDFSVEGNPRELEGHLLTELWLFSVAHSAHIPQPGWSPWHQMTHLTTPMRTSREIRPADLGLCPTTVRKDGQ